MIAQSTKSFTFSFEADRPAHEIFPLLLDVRHWWTGLYGEKIAGKSTRLNDEFTFDAGEGVHSTRQRLIELVPNKTITWQVIDSELSFLKDTKEWTGTRFGFELAENPATHRTQVTFTHEGLLPGIECYNSCTSAWTAYLQKLKAELAAKAAVAKPNSETSSHQAPE